MKKIFILGSNSFSGNHLVSFLLKKKYKVYGCSQSKIYPPKFNALSQMPTNKNFVFHQLDINKNFDKLKKMILEVKPDIIIDFLGQGMVAESWSYPELTFNSNLISKIKLYELLKNKKFLKKYIKISTPEVFGSANINKANTNKYNPSTPYALSHSSIETYLRLIKKEYNFPVIISRFANFYGPYQRLYRVIPLAIHKAFHKEKFYLHGGGKSRRSFIYSEDFCKGLYKMILVGKVGEFYQFSSKEYFSIKEVIEKIYLKFKLDPKNYIVNVKDRPGKDKDYKINDSDTRKKLRWKNEFNLNNGIDYVINWYLENNKKFNTKDKKFSIKT